MTFRCPSEQSYILKGPSVATCSSSGVWEPHTSADNVQCIGKYNNTPAMETYIVVNCTANCGQPMASRNVQLTVYNSTLEGATVVFKCNEGFFPNVTHTGVCQNISMWHPDPADLVCVNPSGGKDARCFCLYYITKVVHYFTVDCGSPSPLTNGTIISQNGTLEGSRITFECDDGFSPSLAMNSECQPDGNWQPDPAGVVCAASMTFTGKLKLMLLNEKVCAV